MPHKRWAEKLVLDHREGFVGNIVALRVGKGVAERGALCRRPHHHRARLMVPLQV